MKSISKLFLGLALVSTGAFAADVAPVLNSLKVTEVGTYGKVVKSSHQHPFSKFLLAIPVRVEEASACTKFVGQTTTAPQGPKMPVLLTAVGATDPSIDACIEIYPMPIETNFTVEMNVLTGGIVAANPVQTMFVNIASSGIYKVQLDMRGNRVAIEPIKLK